MIFCEAVAHYLTTASACIAMLRPAARLVAHHCGAAVCRTGSLSSSTINAVQRFPPPLHSLHRSLSTIQPSTPLASPLSHSSTSASSFSALPSSYPPLNFDDVTVSFASKTDGELLRALFVYRLCTIRPIVQHADSLLRFSHSILGRRLTAALLKPTFFAQFVAGENETEIAPVVEKMERHGLHAILDYAAEADVSADAASAAQRLANAEKGHEANTDLFASSIEAAGKREDGFAAIKLTAMGSPDLLIEVSSYVLAVKRLYAAMLTGGKVDVREVPQLKAEDKVTLEQFVSGLKANGMSTSDEEGRKLFSDILAFSTSLPPSSSVSSAQPAASTPSSSSPSSSSISYNCFFDYFAPQASHRLSILPTLSSASLTAHAALTSRALRLASLAAQHRVRLLVDAEQTYLQPAIDSIALQMMASANQHFPYVYNTYQCYLRDTMSRVLLDMQRSEQEGWKMGAKTVRGAYMWQERKRAAEHGYADPIQPSVAATTANYHSIVDYFLRRNPQQAHLVAAGHNEQTVRWIAARMADYQLPRKGDSVFFGQLLGMCDHVSYSLAASGYRVVKVTPYGPLEEVMPYLIRRAQENADVLDRATKERRLVWTELKRRRLPWLASGAVTTKQQQDEGSMLSKEERNEVKA